DGVLGRHVGAQAHVGQHVQAFDVALGQVFGAGNGDPAGAEARHPIGLGQAVEGQAQHVRRQRGGGDVLGVVVEDLVVDLVGEQDQVVLAGNLHQLLQALPGVHRAGGVVRVDQHQRPGVGGDLGADVVQVGEPAGLLVAQVVHRIAAGQADRGGPQRVIGGGQQHLVAVVQQRLHGHHDQLGHAVAQVDILDAHALDVLLLVI